MIEQLAVVIYGALTIIAAIALASMQHSTVGMVLAFLAAGLTYMFQVEQLKGSLKNAVLDTMQWAIIVLTCSSVITSIIGN